MSDNDDAVGGVDGVRKKGNAASQYMEAQRDKAEAKMYEQLAADAMAKKLAQEGQKPTTKVEHLGSGMDTQDTLVSSSAVHQSGSTKVAQTQQTGKDTVAAAQLDPAMVSFFAAKTQVTSAGDANSQQGGESSGDTAGSKGLDADAILNASGAVRAFTNEAKQILQHAEELLKSGKREEGMEQLDRGAKRLEQAANAASNPSNQDFGAAALLCSQASDIHLRLAKMIEQQAA